jgi:hypothetical protein
MILLVRLKAVAGADFGTNRILECRFGDSIFFYCGRDGEDTSYSLGPLQN